jgi:hypothetical protein
MIRMLSEKPTRTVILEHVLETKVYLRPKSVNDFFSVNCKFLTSYFCFPRPFQTKCKIRSGNNCTCINTTF